MIEIKGAINVVKIYSDTLKADCITEIMELCSCEEYSDSQIILMPNYHQINGVLQGICIENASYLQSKFIQNDIGKGTLAIRTLDNKRIRNQDIELLLNNMSDIKSEILSDREDLCRNMLGELRCVSEYGEDFLELGLQMIDRFMDRGVIELGLGEYGEAWLVINTDNISIGRNIAEYYKYIAYNCKNKALTGLDLANFKDDMDVAVYYGDLLRERLCYALLDRLDLHLGYSVKTITNYIDSKDVFRLGGVDASYRKRALVPISEDDELVLIGLGDMEWGETLPYDIYNRRESTLSGYINKKITDDSILNAAEVNERVIILGRYAISS